MAAWSDFVALISPRTQGCADIVIEFEARKAAIEFCEKTLCHQRVLSGVTTVVGQADYTFTQANEVIERLLAARLDTEPLEILSDHHLDWTPTQGNGSSWAVTLKSSTSVTLFPPPRSNAIPLQIRAAMRPSRAATSIDDDLFERYADAIADGAVARICVTPNRAYTDLAAAADAGARFQEAIASAREGAYRRHARTSVAAMRAL